MIEPKVGSGEGKGFTCFEMKIPIENIILAVRCLQKPELVNGVIQIKFDSSKNFDVKEEFVIRKGNLPIDEFCLMLIDLRESELSRHCELIVELVKTDNSFVAVEMKVAKHAESLLISSLEDGMLRHWSQYFPQ